MRFWRIALVVLAASATWWFLDPGHDEQTQDCELNAMIAATQSLASLATPAARCTALERALAQLPRTNPSEWTACDEERNLYYWRAFEKLESLGDSCFSRMSAEAIAHHLLAGTVVLERVERDNSGIARYLEKQEPRFEEAIAAAEAMSDEEALAHWKTLMKEHAQEARREMQLISRGLEGPIAAARDIEALKNLCDDARRAFAPALQQFKDAQDIPHFDLEASAYEQELAAYEACSRGEVDEMNDHLDAALGAFHLLQQRGSAKASE